MSQKTELFNVTESGFYNVAKTELSVSHKQNILMSQKVNFLMSQKLSLNKQLVASTEFFGTRHVIDNTTHFHFNNSPRSFFQCRKTSLRIFDNCSVWKYKILDVNFKI